MAAQYFLRLLDLPVELQTKVWEETTYATVPGRWRRYGGLGIEFHTTDCALTSPKDHRLEVLEAYLEG